MALTILLTILKVLGWILLGILAFIPDRDACAAQVPRYVPCDERSE